MQASSDGILMETARRRGLLARYEEVQYRVNEYVRNRVIWHGYRKLLHTMVDLRTLPFYSEWSPVMRAEALTHLQHYRLPSVSILWHRAFHAATGLHDHRYVSEPLFFSRIEPRLCQRTRIGKYFDKNFYARLDIASETLDLARVIAGRLTDANHRSINVERLRALVAPYRELVIKPALDSGGGNGVRFVGSKDVVAALAQLKRSGICDLVIQKPVRQCAELAALNPDSVNTLRVLTLRLGKQILNLSTVLRIGRAGSRVDNLASGGLSAGVEGNGRLKPYAYDHRYVRYECHPDSKILFADQSIPAFAEAVELCLERHSVIPDVDLISWDVAITSDNVPIIVELNMNLQGIGLHQLSNGPLFGDFTDIIYGRHCR